MRADPRLEQYASILVDQCVGVQPGWQVLVLSQPPARPLIEEVSRQIARRGAYALLRLEFETVPGALWAREAPEEVIAKYPEIAAHGYQSADCFNAIQAPENTRAVSDLPAERLALLSRASRPFTRPFLANEKPWVGCQYPTDALAQEAGMPLGEFADLLYRSVLIDWNALERDMKRIADRIDRADEVRVRGAGTEITFSLRDRPGMVSAAGANMPSGEVFYSPVEDSVEGVVSFGEYPACHAGHQVTRVRLRFERGRVVEASADSDEEYLLKTLDADEGARVLGEFGIGCNPGIQRHMRNTLFDEKMDGTVHFAVGQGFPFIGGTNESAVHWDMVKDLRREGQILCDGEVVQENGQWRL